jgi:hypothetical protein
MSVDMNSNGLVNGNIPKGTACPFIADCGLSTSNCPTKDKTKDCDFSCAAARAWSLCKNHDVRTLHSIIAKPKEKK